MKIDVCISKQEQHKTLQFDALKVEMRSLARDKLILLYTVFAALIPLLGFLLKAFSRLRRAESFCQNVPGILPSNCTNLPLASEYGQMIRSGKLEARLTD